MRATMRPAGKAYLIKGQTKKNILVNVPKMAVLPKEICIQSISKPKF